MNKQHWQDWLTTLVGAWLIVSPYVLSFALPEGVSQNLVVWNFIVSGLAAVLLGIVALASYRFWEEWANMAVGLWLVVSPWALQFAASPTAKWNAVISGLVIIVAAGWNIAEYHQTRSA